MNIIIRRLESNASGRNLVLNIRQLFQMECEVKVKHLYHEANMYVYVSANIRLS